MSGRVLPDRPDLEQYRKQAKELARDCAAALPAALERIGRHHPHFRAHPELRQARFKLTDAQLTIAREHDFETWTAFAAHIRASRPGVHARRPAESGELILRVPAGGIELEATIAGSENPTGVVLVMQSTGSRRLAELDIATELRREGLCTVQTCLLTEEEEISDLQTGELRHNIRQLGRRVTALTDWISRHPKLAGRNLGYLASGTGAAAAMLAASDRPDALRAVVSCAGRPDLAGPWLWKIEVPTLFVVGRKDTVALGFTQSIMAPLPRSGHRQLAVIEDAQRLLEEPDAFERTAALTGDWFRHYLAVPKAGLRRHR